ncbi:condensation domain-containing protein [Streptomyces sp. NPDC047130]|uniref:condensation domain-containing protein n=1 Tax=Streptomyces sp. NPDC047130 TaxID=3155261 RepID=UPI0033F0826A
MTAARHVWPPPSDEVATVLADLGRPPHRETALELRGPLDRARIEAALDHAAVHAPAAPGHRIEHHGPGHHTLCLTACDAYPVGLLADLLTRPAAASPGSPRVPPTPLQQELLAEADARPGLHVEQLTLSWHGPLDTARFRASWQSVTDRESVLRTAFDDGPEPLLTVHEHVTADVRFLPAASTAWADLVETDRRDGVDPRRPGAALRVTVMAPGLPHGAHPARVLLTYHHALLDGFGARLLLREFYRAYLAHGRLPGGERRPGLPDYTAWLGRHDTGPARDHWARVARTADASAHVPPLATGPAGPPHAAPEHVRLRLPADRAARLHAWATRWGGTESVALQAVWAVLLYRARGARGAAPVSFRIGADGRGVLLDGVENMPAPLRTTLPLCVDVDPFTTVATLLTEVRDRVLDMTAYAWASPGQVRAWARPEDVTDPADDGGLLVFASLPRHPDSVTEALAGEGVRVGPPDTLAALTTLPLTLAAHHEPDGSLVLTATYAPSRLPGVADLLAASALLLSELPYTEADTTTVADVLRLLSTAAATGATTTPPPTPRVRPSAPPAPPLEVLRTAGGPGTDTVCLVRGAGVPRSLYDRLAGAYRGPEAVLLLHPDAGDPHILRQAVRTLADDGRVVAVFGFSGSGATAYETARLVAAAGGRTPALVVSGTAAGAEELARTLETAAARTCARDGGSQR